MPAPVLDSVEVDDVSNLSFSPPPMKARDSISSIDSDVSLSFDRMPATAEDANLADLSDSASDNGGKDSGCEVTPEIQEPPFTPPSDELADKIVTQVEFYFSDANITKDAFLLKHVKRNKEGYVSLKLISSFKRVKHLTKDWRVVAHALSRSTKLQINEAGTKLRRLDPLPQYDQTAPSRTIVAVNMPIDKPSIENVAELFRDCGEIALIRILRPGNPIPADVRQFINKNPSLIGVVCALVEFVDSESARSAIKSKQDVMKVYELNGVPNNGEKKKKTQKKNSNNSANHNHHSMHHRIIPDSSDYNTSSCASGSEAEDFRLIRMDSRLKLRRGSASPAIDPAAWLQRRLSASSTEACFLQRRDSGDSIGRRLSACSISDYGSSRRTSASSDCSFGARSRSNSSAFHLPDNVVRMPQGPDGSRGFRQRV